jgi:hypothetical protein
MKQEKTKESPKGMKERYVQELALLLEEEYRIKLAARGIKVPRTETKH